MKQTKRVTWGLVVVLAALIIPGVPAAPTDLARPGELQDQLDVLDRWLGRTPLMRAAWKGHSATVKALLAAGAPVNAQDKNGMTALMWAASEVAPLLLAHGANPHIRDTFGRTALSYAAYMGDADRVRMLMSRGLAVNDKDAEGQTPLFYALYGECIAGRTGSWPTKELVLMFIPQGPDRMCAESVVQLLLARGARVTTRDKRGRTPFLFFTEQPVMNPWFTKGTSSVDYLIAVGADINSADVDGHTALMWRAHVGDVAMVAFLLKHGANPRARTRKGETALSFASAMPMAWGTNTQVKDLLHAALAGPAGPPASPPKGTGQ